MNILDNNPYRLLGVYSNSSTRERLANQNKMMAFLKVGKQISFPLDLPQFLSDLCRSEAMIHDAEAKLTLPKDQILYGQFWFIKLTPMDEEAFNLLTAGEFDKAKDIWKKKETASSLQNLILCSLICDDFADIIEYAEKLYGNVQYINQFVSAITGEAGSQNADEIIFNFLDVLTDEIGPNEILPFITNDAWESHIIETVTSPMIESIETAIDIAKKSKGKGTDARLEAGENLRNTTSSTLQQLKDFLSPSSLQYQIVADKLGLEILQYGTAFYVAPNEPDNAHKAMTLYNYANSIVVGQVAKDKCKENIETLQWNIEYQSPNEVSEEDKAIKEELYKYSQLTHKICNVATLLNNTKPYLVQIKSKMGDSNAYYLKISTLVADLALRNIIEEVNEAIEYDPFAERKRRYEEQQTHAMDSWIPYNYYTVSVREVQEKKRNHLKKIVLSARDSILAIESLDMDKAYEQKSYLPNRKTIAGMLYEFGNPLPAYGQNKVKAREMEPTKVANNQSTESSLWTDIKENPLSTIGIIFCIVFVLSCTIIGYSSDEGKGATMGFIFSMAILGGICKLYDFLNG